ncbi:MAG TPA: RluA family pseudouridine synthase [Candidatus Acidoferrales bacterium]|nr:RluA family pseudouridine synthase [Candidatus Acidoferrales bacterium]
MEFAAAHNSEQTAAVSPLAAENSPPSAGVFSFSVTPEDAGQRLDRFLASCLPGVSRSRIQSLMEEGRVLVDGASMKPAHRVGAGESIRVEIPAPTAPIIEAEDIPLEVLWQDEDVAVINKPAGMIVHPGAGAASGTLAAALVHHFGGTEGLSSASGAMRPGIVHRLDKDTSGAIVIARTDAAHANLSAQFRDRAVQKTYLALLHGNLKGDSGTVDLPVARDLHRRARMTARRREGRAARTDWRVLLRLPGYTLIDARLHTGRTHQIRVHFAALGCPVVGDTIYGAPRQERAGATTLPPLGRNFLHSARVAFAGPRDGRRVEVRAPLPVALAAYLRTLAAATNIPAASIDAALGEFL